MDVGVVVNRLKERYVKWAWEQAQLPKMSFGDATMLVFEALGQDTPVMKVRIRSPTGSDDWRVLVALHDAQVIPWLDVTNDLEMVEILQSIIANDPEPGVIHHSTTDVDGIHQAQIAYEFTLGDDVTAAVREAYDPESWAFSYLKHIFTNPTRWDMDDHNHAVNILWTVGTKSTLPRAKELLTHLNEMEATGATPEVWRKILDTLM